MSQNQPEQSRTFCTVRSFALPFLSNMSRKRARPSGVGLGQSWFVASWGHDGFQQGSLMMQQWKQANSEPDITPSEAALSCIDGGSTFSACVVGGRVYLWGTGENGEIGSESTGMWAVPQSIFKEPILTLSCGSNHVLAAGAHGSCFSWGLNNYGQLGVDWCPRSTCKNSRSSSHARGTGGPDGTPIKPSDLLSISSSTPIRIRLPRTKRVVAVAGGGQHSILVCEDGEVLSCGSGKQGQLGVGPLRHLQSRPTQGAEGTTDGVGEDEANWDCCCSVLPVTLSTDGLDTLGEDNGDGKPHAKVAAAAAGWAHSALLHEDGSVYTFGWGLYMQLGHGSTENEFRPRLVEGLLGVGQMRRDGTFTGIKSISCGAWHTAAVSATGDVYTWGWGRDGQLGHFDKEAAATAESRVRAGQQSTEGEIKKHSSDQVGHRSQERLCPYPRLVSHEDLEQVNVEDVACGQKHTVVRTDAGQVFAWGMYLDKVDGGRRDKESQPTNQDSTAHVSSSQPHHSLWKPRFVPGRLVVNSGGIESRRRNDVEAPSLMTDYGHDREESTSLDVRNDDEHGFRIAADDARCLAVGAGGWHTLAMCHKAGRLSHTPPHS